jgi:L-ascorbate metabolism protein UlaG (beta-lactamase superfamily)
MTISWFGLSSFKITSKDVTIITDPFGSDTGLSPVRGSADIVVSSDPKNGTCNNFSSISGNPFVITGPGEYDIKGVFVIGTPADDDEGSPTIYSIEAEDIRIAFLGAVKQTHLSDAQKEVLESSDVVLVPVGNQKLLDFEQAAKIATQLEPYIIIPHTYNIPGLKLGFDKLEKFLKEMGGKADTEDKLTIKKKDLVGDSTKLFVLNPQR